MIVPTEKASMEISANKPKMKDPFYKGSSSHATQMWYPVKWPLNHGNGRVASSLSVLFALSNINIRASIHTPFTLMTIVAVMSIKEDRLLLMHSTETGGGHDCRAGARASGVLM